MRQMKVWRSRAEVSSRHHTTSFIVGDPLERLIARNCRSDNGLLLSSYVFFVQAQGLHWRSATKYPKSIRFLVRCSTHFFGPDP
jgi:hypothetical protein